jgi:hypothetical protein
MNTTLNEQIDAFLKTLGSDKGQSFTMVCNYCKSTDVIVYGDIGGGTYRRLPPRLGAAFCAWRNTSPDKLRVTLLFECIPFSASLFTRLDSRAIVCSPFLSNVTA